MSISIVYQVVILNEFITLNTKLDESFRISHAFFCGVLFTFVVRMIKDLKFKMLISLFLFVYQYIRFIIDKENK